MVPGAHSSKNDTKIDLVMWTYNSSAILRDCLQSIERAIPKDNICHKIMVDGGSRDNTENIATELGWDFHTSKKGIPNQANYALGKVDTELFASFEHDILLARDWFPRMMKAIREAGVAVAQGIRLNTGSRSLEAIDRWMYDRARIAVWYYSLDNNLCRTESIKKVGGYPFDCRYSVDGLLRNNVFRNGEKWLVDRGCISQHLRPGMTSHLKHLVRVFSESNVLWEVVPERRYQKMITLLGGPIRGAQIAGETHTPSVFVAYPLMRYVKLVAAAFSEQQTVLRVSMDDYYRKELKNVLMDGLEEKNSGACIFCGKPASLQRETPWGFGNLIRRFGPVMRFCSVECINHTAAFISQDLYSDMSKDPQHKLFRTEAAMSPPAA